MKYMHKATKKTVDATQWFKDGDHPQDNSVKLPNGNMSEGQVVGFYRNTDDEGRICNKCGHTMYEHGMINTQTVCPGCWIVTEENNTHLVYGDVFFKKVYKRCTYN